MRPRYNEPLFNEVLGITNNFLYPSNSKIFKKETLYSEQILFVSGPFVISRFYCILLSTPLRDNLQQLLVDFVRLLMVQFKIRLSPKVPIRRCRPKTDSASLRAIWAHFKPKHPHHTYKPIPAHVPFSC